MLRWPCRLEKMRNTKKYSSAKTRNSRFQHLFQSNKSFFAKPSLNVNHSLSCRAHIFSSTNPCISFLHSSYKEASKSQAAIPPIADPRKLCASWRRSRILPGLVGAQSGSGDRGPWALYPRFQTASNIRFRAEDINTHQCQCLCRQ